MGDLLKFKTTAKIEATRRDRLYKKQMDFMYRITNGFEFLGQDPDVRERFEDGEIEL